MKSKAPETSLKDLEACMDYLHGFAVDGEFEAACAYEYARESKVMREAAHLRREKMDSAKMEFTVEQDFQCGFAFAENSLKVIWNCPSFPCKGWNQLKKSERYAILKAFAPIEIQPLAMCETWVLDAGGIFDKLKARSARKQAAWKKNVGNPKPSPKSLPIVEGWPKQKLKKSPWVHAMFILNFRKSKKQLRKEFEAWLDLPKNQRRHRQFDSKQTGKTGAFKDRLKDLASWRLYRALGCEEALNFAAKHRKVDKAGRPLAFHDPRKEQSKKVPLNQSALYSEGDSAFSKAKARAVRHLGAFLPWEFGTIEEEKRRQSAEMGQRWTDAMKKLAPKVSKSSS